MSTFDRSFGGSSAAIAEEYTTPVIVASRHQDGEDVLVLDLRHANGHSLPRWAPGAHIDLILTPEPIRQYPLCGEPEDRKVWRIAVLREPPPRGSGTARLTCNDVLGVGARLQVRGPRNHFAFRAAKRYLFIASGVGVAPVLPMIVSAEASGSDWQLVYGGHSLESMAFREELARFGRRVCLLPQNETGLPDLDRYLGSPTDDTLIYCCGPEALLDAVAERCVRWPTGCLHTDRFVPRTAQLPKQDSSFDVTLDKLGLTVNVPPDKSILEMLEQSGVTVLSSCRQGICGTCETRVLSGTPVHRDSVLSLAEQQSNEFMMICVSRCAGDRLVLDL